MGADAVMESQPMDRLWSQIRSLERRAQSRDNEARCLRTHRMETMTRELGYRMDSGAFMQFSGPPTR